MQDTSNPLRRLVPAILLAACAAVQAQPLTLAQARELAVERSRQVAAQTAQAASAREMAVAAGQRPDPVLRVGIINMPVQGPDRFTVSRDGMTMRSIGLMQELTRSDKLTARARRYEEEAQGAEATRAATQAAVARDAALAWADLHFQSAALALVREQKAQALLQEQAALASLRAGRGAQADVLAARQAAAQLDDRIAEAEREVELARIALARWIGGAASRPLAPPPRFTPPPAAGDMQLRVAAHPQLRALRQMEAVAEAEAALAEANKQADWSVELMYGKRGPAFDDMVSVNLSVPLQTDRPRRQEREVAARRAQAERARAELEEAVRASVAETQALLATWRNTAARLQRYDSTLAPLAADRVQAALAAYRGGGGSLAMALEAGRAELDTRLERLRLEREAARLALQLDYLLAPETGALR